MPRIPIAPPLDDILRSENVPAAEMTAYERWILPDVGGIIDDPEVAIASPDVPRRHPALVPEELEEPVEEVAPLTAEEVEAIRQAAHEEGYAEGREAGRSAGHAEGYAAGYASGEQDVRQVLMRFSQVVRTLMDAVTPQDDALESALCELTRRIATEVVRRELQLDSSGLKQVIGEAIKCISPGTKRLRIHLNPEDVTFVESWMQDHAGWDVQWKLMPHRNISPGGCIIDTDETVVDARAEKRLDAVLQQVFSRDAQCLTQEAVPRDSVAQLIDEVPTFAPASAQGADEPEDAENPVADASTSDGSAHE